MKKLLILLFALAIGGGCGVADSGNTSRTNRQSTPDIKKETEQKIEQLKVEKHSQPLPASEVQTAPVGDSQTGSRDVGSTLQTGEVNRSELQVSQTLSELNATQTEQGIVINLPENILFDFDKSEIKPEAEPTLRKISELLAFYKDSPMQINGHTDNKGSDDYNQKLSEKRAESVKKYLLEKFSVESSRLKAKGFGESKSISENAKPDGTDSPDGRQKNRRVEVVIENAKQPDAK